MSDREKAFEQWWHLTSHLTRPEARQALAREAYYAAWGGGNDRLTAALALIAQPVQHVEGEGIEHMVATIERLRSIAHEALK